ncbi:MAG: hypothetical protein K9L59_00745 [Desulfobacterales bacterium]|nr:hypothetical protein [Desulfobacterales bacterium]MCF8078112.1 hypothetical protein [Desulfobacterales bacterium]
MSPPGPRSGSTHPTSASSQPCTGGSVHSSPNTGPTPYRNEYFGAAVLVLYGVIPTLQPVHFGRVYAAYGGVFAWLNLPI